MLTDLSPIVPTISGPARVTPLKDHGINEIVFTARTTTTCAVLRSDTRTQIGLWKGPWKGHVLPSFSFPDDDDLD